MAPPKQLVAPRGSTPRGFMSSTTSSANYRTGAGYSSSSLSRGRTPRSATSGGGSSSSDGDDPVAALNRRLAELTDEEQLIIWERLGSGDYDHTLTGEPFTHQFLGPIQTSRKSAEKTGKVRQNLSSAFSVLESTRLNTTANKRGEEEKEEEEEVEEDDTDPDLPEYFKKYDQLLASFRNIETAITKTVDAIVDAEFGEDCDQNQFERLMAKMDHACSLLEKMMSLENTSETTKLFFSLCPSPKKSNLPCPVLEQEEFITAVYKLSENLKKAWKFMSGGDDSSNRMKEKMDHFMNLVDKMGADLETTAKEITEVEKYANVFRHKLKIDEDEDD